MPLLCVRTARRYLALIDHKYGFDEKFFKLFKEHLAVKEEYQKHVTDQSQTLLKRRLRVLWYLCSSHVLRNALSLSAYLPQKVLCQVLLWHSSSERLLCVSNKVVPKFTV
ncbi:hypothetical protein PR048_021483 [Dryococelus australis]|uniref:Uncharacterized protein n=1 Tax=Dryococelus australis TaxID=614101 RepID=A0ABQ9GYC4_9NEOP|nr:hypothetical protein PR048_021483 [Dryococelus australis]